MVAFRASRVEADFGYVEYKVVAQHRERWVSGRENTACIIVHPRLLFSRRIQPFPYGKLLPPTSPPAKYRTHHAE
jgi:hypothetical protein